MKKRSIITGTVFAAATLVTAGTYFFAPSGYISLDLNPSIEIRTNRLDRVASVVGVNNDGEELLEGYRLNDRDLDDVVEDIVDRMVLHGYLGNNQDANILVTVEEGNVKPEVLEKVNTNIESYLEYRNVQANVMGQGITADDDLFESAKEHQVSIGKMSVIQRLVEGDKGLTAAELSNTSIKDLIAYANKNNVSLDFLEDQIDDLDDDRLEHLEDGLDDDDDFDSVDDLDNDDDVDDDDNVNDSDNDDGFDDVDDLDDDDNFDGVNDLDDDDDFDDMDDSDNDDGFDDVDDLDDNDGFDDVDDLDDNDDFDDVNDDVDDYSDDNDDDNDDDSDDSDDSDDNDDDSDDND